MLRVLLMLALVLLLPACAEVELASHMAKRVDTSTSGTRPAQQGNFKVGKPYKVMGEWYYPKEDYELVETGIASWYGPGFQGKSTASGERFDTGELTAAHRTLQMPSLVRVTNLDNGKSVIVRVNDRGPFKRGRVIDVSQKAAELLGFKHIGTAKVKLEVLKDESLKIAEMARSGQSTKGYEVAMNQGGGRVVRSDVYPADYPPSYPADYPERTTRTASLDPVSSEILSAPASTRTGIQPSIPGHTSADGRFYPDPVVTEMPVTRTNIYVQAGSFANADNANRLSASLRSYGNTSVQTAYVKGQTFHRVRIGPIMRVEEADELLSRVVAGGHNQAVIVVE